MWKRRAAELQEAWYSLPIFYFSNTSEIRGPSDPIWSPAASTELDYELEVASLVDTPVSDLSPERAEEAIGGSTNLNKLVALDHPRRGENGPLRAAQGEEHAASIGAGPGSPDERAACR